MATDLYGLSRVTGEQGVLPQRARVVSGYESHQYHLVYHALNSFVTVTLSSFYLDVIKDRLYTSPRASVGSGARGSSTAPLWSGASVLARCTFSQRRPSRPVGRR